MKIFMRDNIAFVKKNLSKKLDEERYEHTLGVAYTAMCLAMRYGADLYKAEIAGLLHDCAKYLPDEVKIERCEKYNISITQIERENPSLLHTKLGAFIAMNKYKVKDLDIINAILSHTTGKPAMTLLEQIIFVADYIEPRRRPLPHIDEIRRAAFVDLNKATYQILDQTLTHLKEKEDQIVIDPMTASSYEYYKQIITTGDNAE